MKTAACKVCFTGWDWNDTYGVKSPTGRALYCHPNGHWSHGTADDAHRLTKEEEAVLKKIAGIYSGPGASLWGSYPSEELELTYEEMALFASASKKTGG